MDAARPGVYDGVGRTGTTLRAPGAVSLSRSARDPPNRFSDGL
jgi:hypothetical protein